MLSKWHAPFVAFLVGKHSVTVDNGRVVSAVWCIYLRRVLTSALAILYAIWRLVVIISAGRSPCSRWSLFRVGCVDSGVIQWPVSEFDILCSWLAIVLRAISYSMWRPNGLLGNLGTRLCWKNGLAVWYWTYSYGKSLLAAAFLSYDNIIAYSRSPPVKSLPILHNKHKNHSIFEHIALRWFNQSALSDASVLKFCSNLILDASETQNLGYGDEGLSLLWTIFGFVNSIVLLRGSAPRY